MGKEKSGNGGNKQGDVGKNALNSTIARQGIRQHAKLLDSRRDADRLDGSFYLRVNEGRSNDTFDAISGVVGLYAFPGHDQPSMHVNVQKEVGRYGPKLVIRLESIQVGHPLHGAVFTDSIFLPCSYIERYGRDFKSRLEDRISAATQELICRYFSEVTISTGSDDGAGIEEVPAKIEASEEMASLLDGVSGFYRHTDELAGTVVLEVYQTRYPVVRIESSDMEDVEASRVFLPLHIGLKDTLSTNDSLPDVVVKQQQAIFELLKFIAAKHKPTIVSPAVKPEQVMGAKELAKKDANRAKQIAQATSATDKVTALAMIRKSLIAPMAVFSGKLGYVEMSNLSGDLIVQFGKVGNDRVVTVEYIGENHMLNLAGVGVGTKVYAGQVLNGLIDRFDAETFRMTQDEVKRGNVLIGYIRDAFERSGIKMKQRKAPDLKKVA